MGIATKSKIPIILLFGPTGVGKTDLVLDLFEGRGEVISVDSVQIYKGLNIGSAKPPPSYLEKIPHHILDICHYSEGFNSADFVSRADRAVQDIASRSLLPILSGGTAFYYKNFCYAPSPSLPGEDRPTREALLYEIEKNGLASLWVELSQVDPAYGATIHRNDQLRIIRALEVFRLTGKPLSSFEQDSSFREEYDFCIIGLDREREELYSRIDRRVEIMFEQGLPQEILSLIRAGAREDHPAMRAIGYKEFFEMKQIGCFSYSHVGERIKRNSRRYAKRQLTFFHSLQGTKWFHPDQDVAIKAYINEFLIKHSIPLLT